MKKSIAIFCGLVIGIWFLFSPGTLYVSLMTAVLLCLFGLSIKDRNQRRIIINICLLAISLRFIFCIFNYYFSWGKGIGADFIPDARAYSVSGQYIAEVIRIKPMPSIDGNEPQYLDLLRDTYKGGFPPEDYRTDKFGRYIGLVYSIFGYSPITVKFINSFISLFAAILLFLLVRDISSFKVARIALFLSLFWPSIFLWSVTGMKDSLLLFFVTLFLYGTIKIREYLNTFEFLLVGGIMFIHDYNIRLLLIISLLFSMIIRKALTKTPIAYFTISILLISMLIISYTFAKSGRPYISVPLGISFLLSIICFLKKKKIIVLSTIFIFLMLLSIFYISKNNLDFRKHFIPFAKRSIECQRNQTYGAESAYRIYPNRYYNPEDSDYFDIKDITFFEFSISYLKGISYSLFLPFPWSRSCNSKLKFLASLQEIAYYFLFPLVFLGFLVSLRYKLRQLLPVVIFLFITNSIYALYEGNIGTLFRHRDILTNFQFIFIAMGIGKLLGYIKNPQTP